MLLPGIIPHEHYAALLQKYLAIAPFLPKDPLDPGNQPTIRHPGVYVGFLRPLLVLVTLTTSSDLTPANVFVSPDTFDINFHH